MLDKIASDGSATRPLSLSYTEDTPHKSCRRPPTMDDIVWLLRLSLSLLIIGPWIGPAAGSCVIAKRGLSNDLVLKGTILTTEGASPNSIVFVQSGRIAHVGDVCGLGTRGEDASVLDCTGSVISPGFINTHEHIDYSTIRPFPDIGERVKHRHDWRVGARNYTMRTVAVNGTVFDATAWGELRHIFSGTTSIIGGEMVPGLARNLDFADGLEDGLDGPIASYDTFPLDDPVGIIRHGDCDYGPDPIDQATATGYHRFLAHVGEGVDEAAANEFTCLSNLTFDTTPAPTGGGLSTDIVAPNFALIHALGLTDEDFSMVAARGAKIVWSPRSNMYLYGKTLNASYLLEAGITVALGTDWLPSGSATMAREAVCGAHAMKVMYDREVPAKVLWEMATINAATVAGFEDHIGSIEVGKLADIVVFEGDYCPEYDSDPDPFAQAIFAPEENIELVLRGGKILLASSELGDLASSSTCEMLASLSNKMACVADELGFTFEEFEDKLKGVYPAVLPGIPPYEPTCEPDDQL
ncbi:metal dependent amidohydrolase [Poronia punctata]|nr:metal dependent amidohydrolase [Poronia punctata]